MVSPEAHCLIFDLCLVPLSLSLILIIFVLSLEPWIRKDNPSFHIFQTGWLFYTLLHFHMALL